MIKVIGIGNRFMMDDGVSIAVLEKIRGELELLGIEVIIGETDIQYCFQQVNEEDYIIVLDSAKLGRKVGSIHKCKLQEAIMAYGETNAHHNLSFFNLIKLYSKPLKGYFIGIEIAKIQYGCELSKELKIEFTNICLDIEKIIFEIVTEA